MIRTGIFGTRGHTLKFIDMINSYAESAVSGIWSDDAKKAEAAAGERNIMLWRTPEEVLAVSDAAVITAPNAYKKDLVIKAAEAGKHIFLEKPLAVTTVDAKVMADTVRGAGVKFYMSDPFVRSGTIRLKEMIAEGILGDVTGADIRIAVDRAVTAAHPPVWNKATALGGILADIGGHGIHIFHYLFGMPDSVYAETRMFSEGAKESGMEDQAQLVLGYQDKIVTASSSWISGGNSAHTFVYGTKGWAEVISLPGPEEAQKLAVHLNGRTDVLEPADLPAGPERHIRYFIRMIAENIANDMIGRDPLSNSGVSIDDAEAYARLIEAAYRSAEEGRRISLR